MSLMILTVTADVFRMALEAEAELISTERNDEVDETV
jgi:hypothetical protein